MISPFIQRLPERSLMMTMVHTEYIADNRAFRNLFNITIKKKHCPFGSVQPTLELFASIATHVTVCLREHFWN